MTTKNSGERSQASDCSGFGWTYGPLAAQTISGTVEFRIRGRANTFVNIYHLTAAIWIANGSGTLQSTLLSASTLDDGVVWDTTYTMYTFSGAITSQTCSAGDYLVMELGTIADFLDVDSYDIEIGDTDATNHGYFDFSATITTMVAPTTLTYDMADSSRLDLLLNSAAPTHTPTTDGVTVTYAVQSGALPTGMSLNASSGLITGTPTVTGSYDATIRVSNALGSADATLSWRVGRIGGGMGFDIRIR